MATATALPTTISENTTLTAEGSPYTGTSVTISSGVTVTAESGALVKLTGTLTAKGTLDVNGTTEKPVVFTSSKDTAAGQWTGISLQAGAGGSSLRNAEVRYAKTGVSISSGVSPEIIYSLIRDNSVKGVSAAGGSTQITGNVFSDNDEGIVLSGSGNPEIAENTIEDCSGYGISQSIADKQTGQVRIRDNVIARCGSPGKPSIYVYAAPYTSVLTGITLSGNTITDGNGPAIEYYTSAGDDIVPPDIDENTIAGNSSDAVWVSGKLIESTTWEDRGFVIAPKGGGFDFKVASGATLTLGPGLVMKPASSNAQIKIDGELIAEGTETEPITFTSIKDDSIGGDTNADGSATQPAPGDWVGINFTAGTLSQAPGRGNLSYVQASYGGFVGQCACPTGPMFNFGNSVDGGPISSPSAIQNSTFEHSVKPAISGNRIAQIADSTFGFNGIAIAIGGTSDPQITGNVFSDNDEGIVLSGSGNPEIAENTIEDCSGYGISQSIADKQTGQVRIRDNVIARCGSPGKPSIYVYAAPYTSVLTGITLSGNTITDGNGPAIEYYTSAGDDIVPPDIDENTIAGNSSDAVWVSGKLIESTTWEDRGFVIAPKGGGFDFKVASGATLTLGPGLVMKPASSNAQIKIDGELIAEGTETEPITFTSIKDDSIGGDTNADGSATQPAPGDWVGINFTNVKNVELNSLSIQYAEKAIDIGYLDSMAISNSDFIHNEAAIEVAQTAENSPELGALSCIPPYLSFVVSSNNWFGETGYPSPDTDIASVVGVLIPEPYAPLFGAASSLASFSAPLLGAGDTVPFSIYSCPALGIPLIPVTPVIVTSVPPEPWFS